ncbi:MAG: TraB/GumN family protein [Rhodanobacter sp.]|nr:MAG: TraB/GumN family protein [Rhodanobacter sp.]TAM14501.1 MAG: TraB/GumN family protein [Rhodanobacter sp.]TAM37293.1 MAG: TraB/GumN family protein [Rhodanobacter sp.]
MRHRLARLLLALLLCGPLVALAHPALWVVRQGATTVYLFGTIHVLPAGTAWRFPALDAALAKSDALYVEITDDNAANMAALVLRYGLDTTQSLSSTLPPFDRGRLEHAVRLAQVPGGMPAVNLMRPWLAALTLTVTPLLKAGFDPALGVDRQLRAQMQAAGKPVRGLETAEEQIRYLADMPTAQQLAFLRATLRDRDHAGMDVRKLLAAWLAGDTDTIAQLENTELREGQPALYQRLLVTRNATWAARIAHLLDTPGTVFVAVGAAHLAGPDSVQAQLEKRGIRAQRE